MSTTRFGKLRRYMPRAEQSDVAPFQLDRFQMKKKIPPITEQALGVAYARIRKAEIRHKRII